MKKRLKVLQTTGFISKNFTLKQSYCHVFVCLSSITPIIIIITRPHLSSPEPQSSTPAPHLILITSRYLSTLLSSIDRRISLIEHRTQDPLHLPFLAFIIIIIKKPTHHLSLSPRVVPWQLPKHFSSQSFFFYYYYYYLFICMAVHNAIVM